MLKPFGNTTICFARIVVTRYCSGPTVFERQVARGRGPALVAVVAGATADSSDRGEQSRLIEK